MCQKIGLIDQVVSTKSIDNLSSSGIFIYLTLLVPGNAREENGIWWFGCLLVLDRFYAIWRFAKSWHFAIIVTTTKAGRILLAFSL